MNTLDACDVCGRTTPEMRYVAVARTLLCARCWRELSRRSENGENGPTRQLALAGVELAQPEGARHG